MASLVARTASEEALAAQETADDAESMASDASIEALKGQRMAEIVKLAVSYLGKKADIAPIKRVYGSVPDKAFSL